MEELKPPSATLNEWWTGSWWEIPRLLTSRKILGHVFYTNSQSSQVMKLQLPPVVSCPSMLPFFGCLCILTPLLAFPGITSHKQVLLNPSLRVCLDGVTQTEMVGIHRGSLTSERLQKGKAWP